MKIHRVTRQLGQIEILVTKAHHQILQPNHALHVIQVAIGYRIGFIQVVVQHFFHVVCLHGRVQPHHIILVRHDGADFQVTQQEHALHDVLFHRFHSTFFGTFLDDGLDFLFRHLAVFFPDTQKIEYKFGALRQQPHERRGDNGQHVHRARHKLGHRLRHAQSDALGHQLSEHNRQISHQHDDDGLCQHRSIGRRDAARLQQIRQVHGNLVAGINTGEDADERDANLHRGKKLVRIPRKVKGFLRRLAAFLGLGGQARLARGNHCHFGHGKHPVQ